MGREDRRHENNHFHSMDYRIRRRAGELLRPHIWRCCNPPPDKSPGHIGQGNREAGYREVAKKNAPPLHPRSGRFFFAGGSRMKRSRLSGRALDEAQ
jgi:hypothetical protein